MIPIYRGEAAREWVRRQNLSHSDSSIAQSVSDILAQVRTRGDAALQELAVRFGDPPAGVLALAEIEAMLQKLGSADRQALDAAAERIQRFARAVMASLGQVRLEGSEFQAGMVWQPVQRAGCYAPAGRHPLPSTVLMTGLAARAAGVPEVCLVCPKPDPAVIYAARLCGIDKVYRMGGAQAVAALAYGTESVAAVDMVVGPGNAYVTEAKRQLQGVIGIDMLAGPSEVTILADGGANPTWLAADLLAQAEHDPDARVVLLTWGETSLEKVAEEVGRLYDEGGYPDFLPRSLQQSGLLGLESPRECARAANQLAPEHLHLAMKDPGLVQPELRNYGALFVGYTSTVPFGDYGAGPNHTLPTAGTARFASGLSPITFLRAQCWLEVQPQCRELASHTARLADLEGLHGHAQAARLRLQK